MLGVIKNTLRAPLCGLSRLIHTSPTQCIEDKKRGFRAIPADDEGVQGEKIVDLDAMLKQMKVPMNLNNFPKRYIPELWKKKLVSSYNMVLLDVITPKKDQYFFSYFRKQNIFPTIDSDKLVFDGTVYTQLPICNIRVSHNNTVVTLSNHTGTVKLLRSCGIEGFKNTKKGTNIAAQTTAISLATLSVIFSAIFFSLIIISIYNRNTGTDDYDAMLFVLAHFSITSLLNRLGVCYGDNNGFLAWNGVTPCSLRTVKRAIDKGFRTVRVKVQGLGPGRLAAVKGLQMGGLNIVSITDDTRVSWNPPRPRKARRL